MNQAAATPPNWFIALLRDRFVQLGIAVWIVFSAAVPLLAQGSIPFIRPMLAGLSYRAQVAIQILNPLFDFIVIAVVWLLTRRRTIPDIAARAPERALALRETFGLLAYGALVLAGGCLIGGCSARTLSGCI